MSLFIGIDLGTSGCRACVIDAQAKLVTLQKTAFEKPSAAHGRITQAPDHWWTVTEQTLRKVFDQIDRNALAAICVDGTSSTTLITDTQGQPLADALMYNDHSSCQSAALIKTFAPPASAAHGASASLAKYLALLEHSPTAVGHVLHQADWVSGKLSGQWGISDTNNALKLGYDPLAQHWPTWLQQLPLDPKHLPRVVAPGTPIGPLRSSLAQHWQVPDSLQVIAGTTDSTAAVLATGIQQPGDAVTSLGSTIVLKVLATDPINAPQHGIYSHRLGKTWLVGGASNSGGAVLQHFFSVPQIELLCRQLDANQATELDYYPLLRAGERFPIADPAWPPKLAPRPTDDAQFLLGLLTGMAKIEAMGYAKLTELGCPPIRRIATVGGGAANQVWTQLRQRYLDIPLYKPQQTEAAYGSALLARAAILGKC